MNWGSLVRPFAVALPVVTLAGCSVFSSDNSGLSRIDDLVTWIERVHVESEMAKEKSHSAIDALRTIVAGDFGADPLTAHTELMQTIQRSENQSDALRTSITGMRETADAVFAKWSTDLLSFTNAQMRQRSQARLEATRARYRAILAAVEPAQVSYDSFNLAMRDIGLFLGNDFNATSVSAIRDDVRAQTTLVGQLDHRLEACLTAARDYLDETSLPMHASPQPPSDSR